MYFNPILRRQTVLLGDLRASLRDDGATRWTDPELYRCINRAIDGWVGRVSYPSVYTFTFAAGVYEYTLPFYIANTRWYVQEQPTSTLWWRDVVMGIDIYPNGEGGMTLRYERPFSGEARVVYWSENGRVPLSGANITLDGSITSSATTLTVNNPGQFDVGRRGYVFIQDPDHLSSEYIGYNSKAGLVSNLQLAGLERGANETVPWSHSDEDPVEWCVAVPDGSLWQQLLYQAQSYAHALLLSGAPAQETEHHQYQMQWYQQQADDFWKRWSPMVGPRVRIQTPTGHFHYDNQFGNYPWRW